jgi:hypothetical protein
MSYFRSSALLLPVCVSMQLAAPAIAQTTAGAPAGPQAMQRASGAFEIAMIPAGAPEKEGRTAIARIGLDKKYLGALAAIGKGQMLTAVTDTKGSAAYVAIERISGTLDGRQGSFVIQHAGTMSGGASEATIRIVPDSGTDALAGISGSLTITVVGGKHLYALDYAFAPR